MKTTIILIYLVQNDNQPGATYWWWSTHIEIVSGLTVWWYRKTTVTWGNLIICAVGRLLTGCLSVPPAPRTVDEWFKYCHSSVLQTSTRTLAQFDLISFCVSWKWQWTSKIYIEMIKGIIFWANWLSQVVLSTDSFAYSSRHFDRWRWWAGLN